MGAHRTYRMVRSVNTWVTDIRHNHESGSRGGVLRYHRGVPEKQTFASLL